MLDSDFRENNRFVMSAISEILELPVKERLDCMERLWSSLKEGTLDSPEWHGAVLEERRKSLESGEANLMSLEELEASLERLRR